MKNNALVLASIRKTSLAVTFAVPAVLFLAAAPVAKAGIDFIDGARNLTYSQTGNGNTTTPTGAFFSIDLHSTGAGDFTSATMTFPGPSSPLSLPVQTPTDFHFQTGLFATKAAMDAAFPLGTYRFNTTPAATTSLAFPADDFPLGAPFLTGTDFISLQGMNPASPFTFHLSPYVAGPTATESFIFLTIFDATLNSTVFSQNFLPRTTTSVTLPASTLAFGHNFTYELDYSNRDVVPTPNTTFPATIGFEQRTTGRFSSANPIVPEPGTALFGLALIGTALTRRARAK